MLIQLKDHASPQQTAAVRAVLERAGYATTALTCFGPGLYAAVPEEDRATLPHRDPLACLRASAAFAAVATVEAPDAAGGKVLTARARRPQGTRVRVGGYEFGGTGLVLVAGPCAVENREQLWQTAVGVRAAGAHLLRGGAYKPRTSPYAFQGLGRPGLEMLAETGARLGMPVITEVMAPEDADLVAGYADILQVGARNMQNFPLLKQLGRLRKPVLLKRSPSATLSEWLGAAEYLLARGNDQVVLCERGIRGFDSVTRNTLDLAAVPALHALTHLPVVVDPSHGTGRRALVAPTARAAIAAGADGLCLEVHVRPGESVSDRDQALSPADLAALVPSLRAIAAAVGRRLGPPVGPWSGLPASGLEPALHAPPALGVV